MTTYSLKFSSCVHAFSNRILTFMSSVLMFTSYIHTFSNGVLTFMSSIHRVTSRFHTFRSRVQTLSPRVRTFTSRVQTFLPRVHTFTSRVLTFSSSAHTLATIGPVGCEVGSSVFFIGEISPKAKMKWEKSIFILFWKSSIARSDKKGVKIARVVYLVKHFYFACGL
jgi:hypothetical protein